MFTRNQHAASTWPDDTSDTNPSDMQYYPKVSEYLLDWS